MTLIDRGQNDFGIKGYLKCDLFMFHESTDDLILSKSLRSVTDNNEINEKCVPLLAKGTKIRKRYIIVSNDIFSNLLIPNGFQMETSHLAKYTITLYKGEMIRYLRDKGVKWLSIYFGELPEVPNYLQYE